MKVTNMISTSGKAIPNQFVVESEKGKYFQSYKTVIALIPSDGSPVQLDKNHWNYSSTTSKYRNMFLGETTKQIQEKIIKGEYILTNLT